MNVASTAKIEISLNLRWVRRFEDDLGASTRVHLGVCAESWGTIVSVWELLFCNADSYCTVVVPVLTLYCVRSVFDEATFAAASING